MKLSFVIPAYNEEAIIGRCLESVQRELAGSPHDVEVVVVNNASTDRTAEIAAGFEGVRVVDEPKKGLVNARRAGFLATDGDIIANIDADTMLTPGWVDTVMREFAKNDRLVALSGPFIYFDLPASQRAMVKVFYGGAFLVYLFNHYVLRVGAMLQGGNFIVRRSALEEIGGYDTTIEFYGEDTDIARRMSKIGRVKWTFALPIYASGRRLKAEGIVTMSIRYSLNYFWVTFSGKPLTREYTDIRPGKDK